MSEVPLQRILPPRFLLFVPGPSTKMIKFPKLWGTLSTFQSQNRDGWRLKGFQTQQLPFRSKFVVNQTSRGSPLS